MTSSRFFPPALTNPPAIRLLVRSLLALTPVSAWAELPVPADVMVAAGAGRVAAPVLAGNTLILRQASDKATLDWKSFNIGADNTVRFEQPHSDSVALNRIHQADPSQILGTLTANGQIYLVNQNGFVFGEKARVEANALVASSLAISQDTLNRGLAQRFSNGNQPALAVDQTGVKPGDIVVETGASLSTRDANGRILLAAPTITQKGTLNAADGQIILAASQDKVYLQQAAPDSDIRGLVVEVGVGGKVQNLGKIMAERGNVSLMGFAVNQDGLVSASTSVRLNGSVRLLAREGYRTGGDGSLLPGVTRRSVNSGDGLGTVARVDSGAGSVTQVTLAEGKTETAVDAQAQSRSHIEITGHTLHLASGAAVLAPSGTVELQALDDPSNPALKGDGLIDLDSGSRVDVSGVRDVSLPMSRNVIPVELRSNELRDAPLQRNGVLHGQTVQVDIRDVDANGHIPIADVSGALARIERSLAERSTGGGSLSLHSSGHLIVRPGSVLDVSGGSVRYLPGWIDTTQLIAGNALFDIAHADPDRHYDGILQSGETRRLARFEPGYVEGKAGGTLDLAAYDAMLEGLLKGATVTGLHQRTETSRVPASSLSIDLSQGNLQGRQAVILGESLPAPDPATSAPLQLAAADIAQSGFGEITVKTNDRLTIPADTRLRLPEYGTLTLAAAGFAVEGSIRIPSGRIDLSPIAPGVDGVPLAQASGLMLGKNAMLSVAGNWVNDTRPDGGIAAPQGGSVHLTSEQQNLILEPGSLIDASGGAWLQGNGQLQYGKGGAISLSAQTTQPGQPTADLSLQGRVQAYGVSQGGRLELASRDILIDTAPSQPDDTSSTLRLTPDFFTQGGFADYHLTANQGSLNMADGVNLAPRQDNLQLPDAVATQASADRLPGTDPVSKPATVRLPDDLRSPVDLALAVRQSTEQNRQSVLRVGSGATITLEPQAQLHLASTTALAVAGSLSAPAGEIRLSLEKPGVGDHGFYASQALWLEAGSRLSATGQFMPERNPLGLMQGEVLPGGSITLNAQRGYLITDPDSAIDVSGTQHALQWLADGGKSPDRITQTIASAGGDIRLQAGEGMVVAGHLKAQAGGSGVSGGNLVVELNGDARGKPAEPIPDGFFPDDMQPDLPRSLRVMADVSGDTLADATYSGQALVSAERLDAAGLGRLTLRTDAINLQNQYVGSIRFGEDIRLETGREIILDSPQVTWLPSTPGGIQLTAPYVALGSTRSRVDQLSGSTLLGSTLAPPATTGPGRFAVRAEGIDLVGGLSFQGFDQADLHSQGDLRAIGIREARETRDYQGALHLAGELNLTASQFYPASLSDYTVDLGSSGHLTLNASGQSPSPLYSAGGSLTLNAGRIDQSGVLAAPFGQLQLDATANLRLHPGSLTTVSGQGLTVPLGRGSGDMNWLYPLDASGLINRLIDTPPEKRLSLSAPAIQLDSGARIDLRGGGDLSAYEFIPGPGGSRDVLASGNGLNPGFAVIPGVQSITTPYDPLEFPASGLHSGDSIYLSGGSGLPAGQYTLLPAHYALLPGAWWIEAQSNTRDFAPPQSYQRLDGATVVAGRYAVADTRITEPRWQGFAVQPGQNARQYAEFHDYSANRFFTQQAQAGETPIPERPLDAGRLTVAAGKALTLEATVLADAPAGGRGGDMDISAQHLAIVGRREDGTGKTKATAAGQVTLLADELNRLDVASLVLGGWRSTTPLGERLTVTAATVELEDGAALSGHELILAARKTVSLANDTALVSTGLETGTVEPLYLTHSGKGTDDGVLVRVSARPQREVIRPKTLGQQGVLTVAPGATLAAEGSILLDATRDTRYQGHISLPNGSLALQASTITLGDAAPDTSGLVIAPEQLAVADLTLRSAGGIRFNGAVRLATETLTLDTPLLEATGDVPATVDLQAAQTLRWFQRGGVAATTDAPAAPANGTLTLAAQRLELGQGDHRISGFDQTLIRADGALLAGDSSGAVDGVLNVTGALTLDTPRLGGYSGGSLAVDAGDITLKASSTTPLTPNDTTGLGVQWQLSGEKIAGVGHFDLPAGALQLTARQGDIRLDSGSGVDVSARSLNWGQTLKTSPAGSITLTAPNGDVVLADGAKLDLSGHQTVGELNISAPRGRFIWNGLVTARQNQAANAPAFRADVADWGEADYSSLINRLDQAGFNDTLAIRQRTGSILLPQTTTLKAHSLDLAADQGRVTLAGGIDASGEQGGEVRIQGSDGITLEALAWIDARAMSTAGQGGRVMLDAVDSALDGSRHGALSLQAGSRIDVSGGTEGPGGRVLFRAVREDGRGEIFTSPLETRITGSRETVLEATRVYPGIARIDADTINTLQADTAGFMARALMPENRTGATVHLRPGIDLRNPGDIQLTQTWDFMSPLWRYALEPGALSIRAGGQLDIQASLSDGFKTTALSDPLGMILPDMPVSVQFRDVMQPGASWSYHLQAGADLRLAPNFQSTSDSGKTRREQVMLRTGTGDIRLEAGGDIRFLPDPRRSGAAAAVYTVGSPAAYTWGDLMLGRIPGIAAPKADTDLADYLRQLDPARLAGLLRHGYFNEYQSAWQFVAEYPTGGGDVRLSAGGDISGIQTGQRVSDWLVRTGTWSDDLNDTTRTPTAWGLNLSGSTANETVEMVDASGQVAIVNVRGSRYFNQNVGALGGGSVTVTAGGHVLDLSVMAPSTGKPFGILTTPNQDGKPDLTPYAGLDTRWLENGTVVAGGGSLSVQAGGNIQGGEFYADRGTGTLNAGDGILPGPSGLATIALLGDARFDLSARQDLHFGTALNPTLLPQQNIPDFTTGRTADFITYSDTSALGLQSTGGTLRLQSGLAAWTKLKHYSLDEENEFNLVLYPGTLQAAALSGDLLIKGSINLMPSPEGQLELLAGRDLGTEARGNNTLAVNFSDADASLFPRVAQPETQLISNTPGAMKLNQLLDASNPDPRLIHAPIPVHVGDTRPALLAARQDIAVPDGSRLTFFLPKATDFLTGRDFRNISLYGQNLNASDATTLQAGRDLVFTTVEDINGNVASLDQRIQWGGPGQVAIMAGRNISLGGSNGVSTVGNLANRALPGGEGAALELWAGLTGTPDYAGFFNQYLGDGSPYLTLASTWPGIAIADFTALPEAERIRQVLALPDSVQRGLAVKLLFQEIRQAAGNAAAAPETERKALYEPGFKALQTLFPHQEQDPAGGLSLVFSQIKSFDGGGIDLLVPGGDVNVGLAGQVGGVRKSASQLGIVVQGRGDFNAYTEGDFNVNQSRVFTLGGGDIAIWSSTGSIDAGKGAKSAISAPPPITTLDEKGNIVTLFPPIVSGSGIQAISPATAGAGAGSVYLAAPAGVVNAGEAGISGGKVVIAASAVIGAANIQASGGTVGVPTAVAPPAIPSGASGAAAGAARAATQTGEPGDNDGNRDQDAQERGRKAVSSLLTSEVVGYGSCSVAEVRNGQPGCGGGG